MLNLVGYQNIMTHKWYLSGEHRICKLSFKAPWNQLHLHMRTCRPCMDPTDIANIIRTSCYEVQIFQRRESSQDITLCKMKGLRTTWWLLPAKRSVWTLTCLLPPISKQDDQDARMFWFSTLFISHHTLFSLKTTLFCFSLCFSIAWFIRLVLKCSCNVLGEKNGQLKGQPWDVEHCRCPAPLIHKEHSKE